METFIKRIKRAVSVIEENQKTVDEFVEEIETNEISDRAQIPLDEPYTAKGRNDRLNFLKNECNVDLRTIGGNKSLEDLSILKGNIENYIGMAQVPIGVMGPLKVKGLHTNGNYYIPLATTEGALVASYHRGAKACTLAGGVTSIFMTEGVQRSPLFQFRSVLEAGQFTLWIAEHLEEFRNITAQKSSHAELQTIDPRIQGNQVIVTFEYSTGDAAGQNMVTICTQAICEYIINHVPVDVKKWYIEGNYSGDKKANAVSFARVRGRKVTAEVVIPEDIVGNVLKSTPKEVADYWKASTVAVLQTGTLGAQGHFANGLTAIFMACGQDVACISEASVGVTRMEVNENGDLYAAVTLPNLIVGTVGGGTSLPTQKECLELMGCYGKGKANKFAEICCAVVLAGELSIAAAMSVGHFTTAHEKLGRK